MHTQAIGEPKIGCLLVAGFLIAADASGQTPVYSTKTIVPNGQSVPVALAPGMLVSIFGDQLGPQLACNGSAEPQRRETPHPARPNQTIVETQIFPKKLCDTEVRIGDASAGLLYVQAKQINFKVPQEVAVRGTTQVRVLYRGRPGPAVTLNLSNQPDSPPSRQLVNNIVARMQGLSWNAQYRLTPGCLPVPVHPSLRGGLGYSRYCPETASGIVTAGFYYPVGVRSPKVLLRRADFRLADPYPSMSAEVEQLLQQKLTQLYGPPAIPGNLYEIAAQLPQPGLCWRAGAITLFLHRNRTYVAPVGVREGVTLIAVHQEILSERDRRINIEQAFRSATGLSHPVTASDLSKELGPLYLAAPNSAANQLEQPVLASLLRVLGQLQQGPPSRRAALLVAADDLVVRLGRLLSAQSVESVQRQLAPYGIHYIGPGHYSGQFDYNRGLLARAWKEFPEQPWGQRAFLMLQASGCSTRAGSKGPEYFRDVITEGEQFLSRYPETTFRKEELYHLALAQETWWSLSQAAPGDPTAEGSHTPKNTAETARIRAIQLYEELYGLAPQSTEALDGQMRLPRLKLKLDTGERAFFCFED